MSETIDSLDIQIKASATKADDAIDKLVGKLEKLSMSLGSLNASGLENLAKGVNGLSSAMQGMKNVGTSEFTRLAKNIQKLGSFDTNSLSKAAGSIHSFANSLGNLGKINTSDSATQIGELAKGISRLGYKSSTQAIENIPKLAKAMRQLMTELSKAPRVSQNLIQMTNALANLASQGNKAGTASNSIVSVLNRFTSSSTKAKKSTLSLAAAFGKFYASYFLVIRGMNKLWSSIKSSMNYVETLNYFNAAFGQVAEKADLSQWKNIGYDAAETYYNSFSKRAQQLTEKMTGFTITDSGMLEAIGEKSLGIDPNQLMNYQAMFAQMSSSMGIASETSLKLSNALTEIGADLASVKNMDFDKVWTDMASGLAGMSRTLDKYGVNIRNVNLQQKLNELGINANITSLNQNEKALLRTIILLDSTRYAWGDLADTLGQPANQLRLLRANFNNLARTVGNIFLPTVAKLLPYVNMLTVSLQRLGEWIVKLLGYEDFDWGGVSGTGGVDLSDILGTDDAEDGVEGTTNALKKLKNVVLGFDELNIMNEEDNGNSTNLGEIGVSQNGLLSDALDKILDEYQAAWDKAFDNMETRYNQFADNVANAFKTGGMYGVGAYLSGELTNAINGIEWESVYEGAKSFAKGFAQFLNGLITPDLFGSVGRTIAGALNTAIYSVLSFGQTVDWDNLGESIATGINDFFTTFDFGALAETLNTWVSGLIRAIGRAIQEIKWGEVLSGIYSFFSNLKFNTFLASIGSLIINGIGLKGIKNGTGLKGIPIGELPILISSFAFKFQGTPSFDVIGAWIIDGIEEVIEALLPDCVKDFIGKFVAGFSAGGVATGGNPYGALIGGLIASFPIEIDWKSVTSFEWTMQWFEEAKKAFMTAFDDNRMDLIDIGGWILEGILDGFVGAITFIIEPIARFFNELIGGIMDIFGIASPAKAMKPIGEYILLGIVEGFSNKVSAFNTAISSWFNQSVKPWFTMERWNALGNNAKNSLFGKWNEFTSWWRGTGIPNWWNNNVTPWFTKDKWLTLGSSIKSGISTRWNEFTQWWSGTGFAYWWNNVKNYFTKDKWTWSGISDGMTAAWNNAIASIKKIWNSFASWLNNKLNFKWDAVKIGGVQVVPSGSINLGKIPTFEGGGYPTSGEVFMARENGINEMVGRIGNRSAVANNDQIVASIQGGVEAAMMNVMMAFAGSMGGKSEPPVIENVWKCDSETMYRMTQKGKDKHDRRYHVVTEF